MSRGASVRRRAEALTATVLLATGAVACSRGPERSVEALCAELVVTQELDEGLASGDLEQVEARTASLRRAVRVAPEDIEGDLALLSEISDAVAAALRSSTGDPFQAMTDALAEELPADRGGLDALTDAGRSLEAWSLSHCGLDLTTGTTVLPPRPGGTTVTTGASASSSPGGTDG